MNKPVVSLLMALLASASSAALADPWKDKGGKGREHKEAYWDGNCKVERKYEKHGGYKEKRKCKGGRDDYAHQRYDDRRYDDRRYDDRRYERPVVQERYYAPNSNYVPDYGYERREPEVRIDVRVR